MSETPLPYNDYVLHNKIKSLTNMEKQLIIRNRRSRYIMNKREILFDFMRCEECPINDSCPAKRLEEARSKPDYDQNSDRYGPLSVRDRDPVGYCLDILGLEARSLFRKIVGAVCAVEGQPAPSQDIICGIFIRNRRQFAYVEGINLSTAKRPDVQKALSAYSIICAQIKLVDPSMTPDKLIDMDEDY
jgi:hypothetical protein